ncbi:hypothetical protein [Streptomyces sp. NPDC057695]|uniref:hypothetical protein n=1 Tax=Streptomyces sp. NPDC057695 TaxID=3346217 RepID=UPI00368B05FD
MEQFFFSASKDFGTEMTRLLDFVRPASVALWNLRWQVQGFVAAVDDATDDDLSNRFASGSGFQARNLRRICVETPWDDQVQQFAQIVAGNVIALFESWAEKLFLDIGLHNKHHKWVQFPSRGINGRQEKGIRDVIADVHTAGTSSEMRSAFFPVYASSKRNGSAQLDELILLYRYHKEIRNAFMHAGGRASQRTEDAWAAASHLTRADVGGRRNPVVTPVTTGQQISYRMEQANDLASVVIRLIHGIDAELCYSAYAEEYFLTAWRSWGDAAKYKALPGDPVQRERRIAKICRKNGFVAPTDPTAVITLGRRAGLAA